MKAWRTSPSTRWCTTRALAGAASGFTPPPAGRLAILGSLSLGPPDVQPTEWVLEEVGTPHLSPRAPAAGPPQGPALHSDMEAVESWPTHRIHPPSPSRSIA